jgi:hypothetical protein
MGFTYVAARSCASYWDVGCAPNHQPTGARGRPKRISVTPVGMGSDLFFRYFLIVFLNSPHRETPKNVIKQNRETIGFGFLVDFFVKTLTDRRGAVSASAAGGSSTSGYSAQERYAVNKENYVQKDAHVLWAL